MNALTAFDGTAHLPEFSAQDARRVAEILSPFTNRRQGFIRAIAAGNTPVQAVKAAGYTGLAKLTAKRLLTEPAVAKAIDDLRDVLANQVLFDFESAHATLMETLDFARKTNNATAAVRAAELLAKLHGHLTDKLDVSAKGDVAFVFPDFRKRPDDAKVIEADHAE